jgi:hypothetical protein
MRVTRIEGRERREVQKPADHEYADDLTTRVRGSMTTVVGKSDKKRSWVTHAEGTAALSGLDKLELRSDKELVLAVGKSAIRITAEKIEVLAPGISAKGEGGSVSVGEEGITLKSKDDARLEMGKKMLLETKGASLSMEKEVKVDGSTILLNSPEQATDAPPEEPEPPTKIELTDEADGSPLPYQRFVVKLDDGTDVSGATDKDGKAELELSSGGKVVFPGVTMPEDRSGKGVMLPYVIRQGDYLKKLAFVHGFDADEVWDDPKNAELKRLRKDPDILAPGDVVHLPAAKKEGLPLQKGAANAYQVKVPRRETTLRFAGPLGPYANEAFTVEGLGEPISGTTDAEGSLTLSIPVAAAEVQVRFDRRRKVFRLHVGHMDPISEPSGVQARLAQIGLYHGPLNGQLDEDTLSALAVFQEKQGLPVTREPDEATLKALQEQYGS